jgi:hypothetical protein
MMLLKLSAVADERERGVELEKALTVEQDRASDLIGKLTFYGNAYQKLQGKLNGGSCTLCS